MNFLRIQKEVARYRGELQNDSISGISSDERQLIKDGINREYRHIADLNPPFLKTQKHVKLKASVPLRSAATTYTVTGTKGIPILTDSNSTLSTRHINWLLTDGTHRYRIIGVSGTTYNLGYGSFTTATTATLWTAYKDVYPVPHDCGRIDDIWIEEGDSPLQEEGSTAFRKYNKRMEFGSQPWAYSHEAFTNKWSKYKFQLTSITATNAIRTINVGTTTNALKYDDGDVLRLDTATTAEYLHTVDGIDVTNTLVYLDRPFEGDTGLVTVQCNPVQDTRYVSFFSIPDTDKDILIDGYIKPPPLVADADECIFPEDLCDVIIRGTIRDDAVSRSFLSDQQNAWYEAKLADLKRKNFSGIKDQPRRRAVLGGMRRYRASDTSGF